MQTLESSSACSRKWKRIFWNHTAHGFCFPVKASSQINRFGFILLSPPGSSSRSSLSSLAKGSSGPGGADGGKSSGTFAGRQGRWDKTRGQGEAGPLSEQGQSPTSPPCQGNAGLVLRGFLAELQLWFGLEGASKPISFQLLPGARTTSTRPGCFPFFLLELVFLGNLLEKSGFSTANQPAVSSARGYQNHPVHPEPNSPGWPC